MPPPPPEPVIQTAARLLAEGRPAEAVARLAALTAEAPTYAAAHVLHATALEAVGDVDGALAAWAHAAALVPLSPLVHREHARLLAVQARGAEDDDLHEDDFAVPFRVAPREEDDGPDDGEAPDPPDAPDEWAGWHRLTDEMSPPAFDVDRAVVDFGEDATDGDDHAGPSVADELDALIAQLEDAPRIKPDPAFDGPAVRFDHGDADEVASETLAQIYAAQRQYDEAALVYEKLAAREPERAAEMLERAAEMRNRA